MRADGRQGGGRDRPVDVGQMRRMPAYLSAQAAVTYPDEPSFSS